VVHILLKILFFDEKKVLLLKGSGFYPSPVRVVAGNIQIKCQTSSVKNTGQVSHFKLDVHIPSVLVTYILH